MPSIQRLNSCCNIDLADYNALIGQQHIGIRTMEHTKNTQWGLIRASHINDAIHVDVDGEPVDEVGALDQRFINQFSDIKGALIGAINEAEIELISMDCDWSASTEQHR